MVEELTPQQFVDLRQSGENWQLLDVREAWEIETASVPDSIRIPMAEIPGRRQELAEDTPIAVLCHSGVRSARVAAYLAATGFKRVVNITGGIDAWSLGIDATIPRY